VSVLISIAPSDPWSPMFHTPNIQLAPLMAEAMGKPSVMVPSSGDEAGDLDALRSALTGLDVDGVVTGAIASDYQWDRINGVCEEIGLRVFSPLWRKDQETLLREMAQAGVKAVIVNVAAEGLGHEWLGREIDEAAIDELKKLSVKHGINIAGEGGEYETFTIDSPMHLRPLRILESEIARTRDGGSMKVTRAVLGAGA